MMKYRLITKFIVVAALVLGLQFFGNLQAQGQSVLSGVIESLQNSAFLLTDSRAEMKAKNDELRLLLSQSLAENILISQKKAQTPESAVLLDQPDSIDHTDAADLGQSDEVVEGQSIEVATVPITAVPVFNFSNPVTYQFRHDATESLSANLYAADASYLIGRVIEVSDNVGYIETFGPDTEPLQAIVGTDLVVPITIENRFTYSIIVPSVEYARDGLVATVVPDKLLGLRLDRQESVGDSIRLWYQLPFQPEIGQQVDLIAVPQPESDDANPVNN